MRRTFFAVLGLALSLAATPVVIPAAEAAVAINFSVGTNLNNGRTMSCREGERRLRNRGFRNVRRVDCHGRFFVYHASRGHSRYSITVNARNGRVVEMWRIRR